MDKTINYYDDNALEYIDNTVGVDMTAFYDRFEKYLPKNAYILDLGCGSGRDSKHFLSQGYKVKAIDGSEKMCEFASRYLGQKVDKIRFEDITYQNEFDAIWACASLLHIKREELENAIEKLKVALKNDGILYVSFKYGDSDRMSGERYFNDMNEISLKNLLKDYQILEQWFNYDMRPGRSEKWINVVGKLEQSNEV